jgi:hypothetical protein
MVNELKAALLHRVERCECRGDQYGQWGPCPQCQKDESLLHEFDDHIAICTGGHTEQIVENIRSRAYCKWLDDGGGYRSQEETDRFWDEAEVEEIEKVEAAIVAVAAYANQRCR